jgi:hypothetical protein
MNFDHQKYICFWQIDKSILLETSLAWTSRGRRLIFSLIKSFNRIWHRMIWRRRENLFMNYMNLKDVNRCVNSNFKCSITLKSLPWWCSITLTIKICMITQFFFEICSLRTEIPKDIEFWFLYSYSLCWKLKKMIMFLEQFFFFWFSF